MNKSEWIETAEEEGLYFITLNRPEKRNALNAHLVQALQQELDHVAQLETVKAIVLKGNGKVFSAGADLQQLQDMQTASFEENLEDSRRLASLFKTIVTHPKVIIALVHGHAIAGGCGLATVCDIVLAQKGAKFGYTETQIGFVPAIVSAFLSKKIGDAKARWLLLSGQLISAEEAEGLGLIAQVFEETAYTEQVQRFLTHMKRKVSSQALDQTKRLLRTIEGMNLESGMEYASLVNARARGTSDCKRGIASFLNKEPLDWGQ